MRTITRTEITVETREVMVMNRRGSLFQSWCGNCGEQAGMVRLEEAALAGVSLTAICRRVEADTLHLIELSDGLNFICLNSLLK
jgi:hypothetical protein